MKSLASLIAIIFIATLSGCAGGSSFEGIGFRGRITGSSAEGITVELIETGEADVVDASGQFIIASTSLASSAELRFTGNNLQSTVVIPEIPNSSEEVNLIINFDAQTGEIRLVSVTSNPGEIALSVTTTTTTTTLAPSPSQPTDKPNPFGIPEGLNGNLSRGKSVWSRICQSCHLTEKRGATYSDVRTALRTEPQMRSLSISNQQTADVVTYLNRSNR